MTFDAETLKQQIPYYLTASPAQKKLVQELKAISEGAKKGYFLQKTSEPNEETMLQGDGWEGFQIFSFDSGNRKAVRGIVLSNSCDISPDNERAMPPKVTFAPIVKLSALERIFDESGLDKERVASKLEAIRMQSVTSYFYLPATAPLDDEYVALLDDLHSMPFEKHRKNGVKLFTLSMAGFYLFVFKLSVHFCRLQESVDRTPEGVTA